MHGGYTRGAALVAALILGMTATVAAGCSGRDDGPSGPGTTDSTDGSDGTDGTDGTDGAAPPADTALWVDPDSPAARQAAEWERQGRAGDAEAMRLIAEQPIAEWPQAQGDPGPRVREVARAADALGQTAVFVAYNIPHRDCGQYSQGGAADGSAYLDWIGRLADGIGDSRAIVVLEPDAVPHLLDGCTAEMYHERRYELLSQAVQRLAELPRTRVYLDAGNPSWVQDVRRLAEALRRAGVERADGFSLNVSNYQTTEDVVAYGTRLSEQLDGAGFVIDTSRNGNGPAEGHGEESWCNPPGRALGRPPTLDTGLPLVDAFLWIKRPGESDGECRGGPRAGEWWPEYALGLAREAQNGHRDGQ
ncbi:glycoside hydrolase family 6 protein [Streptomyces sp. YIM 98790]|uniref:glycoside hydrolase family 6 protein n=1 Tax=Streptomyces sp. YIM 98790 TaxID=2689077 RepID=UPI001FB7C137|nr:glycoside hydrolase family 6 protein [Streptomyces sp. YIM 98790]